MLLRVLRGRIFFSALDSLFLTPGWDPEAPDQLLGVTERYKVRGAHPRRPGLRHRRSASGLLVHPKLGRRPTRPGFSPHAGPPRRASPAIDAARSVRHGLGFVPMVWIRNLPGGDDIDGACTFRPAVETGIEIDYQLSQAGRGLKYSSDPMLLIREPAGSDSEIIRGGGNALVVSEKGDAKLLEIGGTAAAAVIEYVRALRELALEGVHGNRASADRLSAAQSGRALELMNQGLIWLADNLRVSYGGGLLPLCRMVVRASHVYAAATRGRPLPPLDPARPSSSPGRAGIRPPPQDRRRDAASLQSLRDAGLISRETRGEVHRRHLRHRRRPRRTGAHHQRRHCMTDDIAPPETLEERAAALELRLAELEASTRARLIRAELKAEAMRAGMVDLDGLRLLDLDAVAINDKGEVEGGPG